MKCTLALDDKPKPPKRKELASNAYRYLNVDLNYVSATSSGSNSGSSSSNRYVMTGDEIAVSSDDHEIEENNFKSKDDLLTFNSLVGP